MSPLRRFCRDKTKRRKQQRKNEKNIKGQLTPTALHAAGGENGRSRKRGKYIDHVRTLSPGSGERGKVL